MARPTFRSVASATAGYNSTSAANPATFVHAGIGGANKIIYVFATSNGGDESTWTCTVGGVTAARVSPSAAPSSAAAVWRLVAPADGDLTVSISHDQAAGTLIANSIVMNDAAQTGLTENFTVGTSSTGTHPTVTQTSDADSIVIDFLFSRAFIESLNETTTQRSLANSGNAGQAIGTKNGEASTVMGWTVQSSGDNNYDMSVSVLGITATATEVDATPVSFISRVKSAAISFLHGASPVRNVSRALTADVIRVAHAVAPARSIAMASTAAMSVLIAMPGGTAMSHQVVRGQVIFQATQMEGRSVTITRVPSAPVQMVHVASPIRGFIPRVHGDLTVDTDTPIELASTVRLALPRLTGDIDLYLDGSIISFPTPIARGSLSVYGGAGPILFPTARVYGDLTVIGNIVAMEGRAVSITRTTTAELIQVAHAASPVRFPTARVLGQMTAPVSLSIPMAGRAISIARVDSTGVIMYLDGSVSIMPTMLAHGSMTLLSDTELLPESLVNANSFGNPLVTQGGVVLDATGVTNVNQFGSALVSQGVVVLDANGVVNTNSFGTPVITTGQVTLATTGVENTNAFGAPVLSTSALNLLPEPVVNVNAFGAPVVTTGAVTLDAAGVANTNGFGNALISQGAVFLDVTAVSNTNTFGAPVVSVGTVTLSVTGVANTNAFGSASVTTGAVALEATGVANTNAFGGAVILSGNVSKFMFLF